ncbi:MAG TPA: D-tyrosyl-tRNA(Tyr) deacylase, partial [Firmicutes bacterium]|nr:D-tyrosyl-tRNA(Tyr) deacylase [Bacillota bacterium]
MRAVVQRVSSAAVKVAGEVVSAIRSGLVIFLGVGRGDQPEDCLYLADKVANLRIFEDEQGLMNLSIKQVSGEVLCISQFTLYGDCRKGRRPSFSEAAPPEQAERLYLSFCEHLCRQGLQVATGQFGAFMEVTVENSGPVTILL